MQINKNIVLIVLFILIILSNVTSAQSEKMGGAPNTTNYSTEVVKIDEKPSVIQEASNSQSTSSILSSEQTTNSNFRYNSHIYTISDVVFFSYKNGTYLELHNSAGSLIWNNAGKPLNEGEHAYVSVNSGVYTAYGSQKFSILTGDPITRNAQGYYAADQNGYGASKELYTYVPQLYGHCSFIVFAYQDNTQVFVADANNGQNIATVTLNKGQHWKSESLSQKWIHIKANKPVSALTAYDQGYYIPSANDRWSGTEFYTYVSDIQSWVEDLTVIAYNNKTSVTIKNSDTGNVIWTGMLNSGQAHVEGYPTGANKFFTVKSDKNVTVSVFPWKSQTTNYYTGTYVPDSTGKLLGTDIIGSTLAGGYLYVLPYENNTNVVVSNSQTGQVVKSYKLNKNDYVDANPGNGLWRIKTNHPVAVYSGFGQWNAGFAPVVPSATKTYAYTTNDDGTVSVIDTTSDTVTATVKVGNDPYGVAVTKDGTKIYVTDYKAYKVNAIDTTTNKVTSTVPVGKIPVGVAVTPDGKKTYVANEADNTVSVIDTATNKVKATVKVGSSPYGVSVTPDGKKVYVTNSGGNTVSIIDTTTNKVTGTVSGLSYPGGITINPAGTAVYVSSGSANTVYVIDTATNKVKAKISVGKTPVGVAVSPDGANVYVANNGDNTASVIDTSTNKVKATVKVGSGPYGVSVTPDGTKIYVANRLSNSVSIIDKTTNKVKTTVKVGNHPKAFGQSICTVS